MAQETYKSTTTVETGVRDRIQKCLDLAADAKTSEADVKRNLIAYNNGENKARYGGDSVVTITSTTDPSKRVIKEAFGGKLASAMYVFFDCKCFSVNRRTSVRWTFFGIVENTVAAAMGFEIAHNKILDWACAYKGGPPTFSYRLRVADGLVSMVYCEKDREIQEAKRKELDIIAAREREEAKERERELNRLQNLPPVTADTDRTNFEGVALNESEGDCHVWRVIMITTCILLAGNCPSQGASSFTIIVNL
ncbi:hypothetical protein PHISCL_05744 [Aspergillus sclerotialis]|uniref:DUF7168 domain-containing protein n=1 Tax=Aspergillus sclerotialis TaxID=2070753 RepID=A0A3A2ZFF8_9EURO|nr:hypothetical protein PHISCL_05744 [Aspergillus sclerotialis]